VSWTAAPVRIAPRSPESDRQPFDDEAFVHEPQPAIFLQHVPGRLQIAVGPERLGQAHVLDLRDVTIAHVEDQADARMYDGRVEATFHIPDVRVGDVVEWSFTVSGWNPVLRGQVLGSLWATSGTSPATD